MSLGIGKSLRQTGVIKISLLLVSGLITVSATPLTKASPVQAPSRLSHLAAANQAPSTTHSQAASKAGKDTSVTKLSGAQKTAPKTDATYDCTSATPMRSGMAQSSLSQLQKLSAYEQLCQSGIADRDSFFTTLPTTTSDAVAAANNVAQILKEYARFHVQPLVFLEPTNDAGMVSLSQLGGGAYDGALQTYFAQLKSVGITDAMMGTWVPIPEGNLPEWSSVDPGDFSASVTKIVSQQKNYFPASKSSVLLDTRTYPRTGDWTGGRAISLLPYIQPIPKGLLDSMGLQGFPWEPAANLGQANNGTPADYLRVDLLIEAARSAGVRDVWVNSGTFSTAYSGQGAQQVTKTPAERSALLNGVLAQLGVLQKAGLSPSMHLFAEDKSHVAEAINWSYLSDGQSSSDAINVFKSFTHELQSYHIPLWLFDAKE